MLSKTEELTNMMKHRKNKKVIYKRLKNADTIQVIKNGV